MDWNALAQDRESALANMVINSKFSKNAEKFLSSCTTGSFSRRV
jgi:hypothetical protein